MTLDKSIKHGKDRRKPYHGSGQHDQTCRPGGSCPYCQDNRAYKNRKRLDSTEDQLKDGED